LRITTPPATTIPKWSIFGNVRILGSGRVLNDGSYFLGRARGVFASLDHFLRKLLKPRYLCASSGLYIITVSTRRLIVTSGKYSIDFRALNSRNDAVHWFETVQMLRPRERFIYMFRFQPTVRTTKIAPPSALDLMKAVELVFKDGKAFEDETLDEFELPKRTAIKAMKIDGAKTATVLLSFADPQISDTAFEHLETGKLRYAEKADGECVSFACHMVLSLEEDQYGTYPMVLEEVPYLSRSRVVPFIKRLVKNSPQEFVEEDENGQKRAYRPSFEVNGDLSQRLEDELKDGFVRDIVLMRRTKVGQGLDEDGYYHETSRQIRFKIAEENKKEPWLTIEKVRSLAKKEKMDTLKVHYVRDDDKSRTVEYRTDQAFDPQDAMNVRCEFLELDYDLPNSRASIDTKLEARMKKLLGK
jgi:hypothetical protein